MGWENGVIFGRAFSVYTQPGVMNCGPSSVAMVIDWLKKARPTIRSIETECGGTAARWDGYRPAKMDRIAFHQTAFLQHRLHTAASEEDWHNAAVGKDKGSTPQNLVTALHTNRINAVETPSPSKTELSEALRHATKNGKRPLIILLRNPNHFVAVHSSRKQLFTRRKYIVGDPDPGVGATWFDIAGNEHSPLLQSHGWTIARPVESVISITGKIP